MVFMPRFSVAIVDLQKYVLLPLIGPGHHGVALRVERDGWIINVINNSTRFAATLPAAHYPTRFQGACPT
jgi:hypothetical protein